MVRDSLALWLETLSIRSRINLLVLGVMLPVAALVALILANEARRAEIAANEKVAFLANDTATELQRALREFESALVRLSARLPVRAPDAASCDPMVEEPALVDPASVGFEVLDVRGNVVCQSGLAPVAPPLSHRTAAGRAELPADGIGAGNVFVDERTGKRLMALSYPIRDDKGARAGLMVLLVDLQMLNAQLLASIPKDLALAVVDRSGAVLLLSPGPEEGSALDISQWNALLRSAGLAPLVAPSGVDEQ